MDLKPNHKSFEKEIKDRNIEYLVHFTPTINLYSILEHHALMCRARLECLAIDNIDINDFVQFTDSVRNDDKNYINLSLSCPNTFLFSKFKKHVRDNCTITWSVLKIDPKYIYEKNTLFAVTNAASNAAKNQFGITGDLAKFKLLFSEQLYITTSNGIRSINRKGLHPKYPTDIQAEVLVKGSIPSDGIIEVCFDSEDSLAEAKAAMSIFETNNFVVDKVIFSPNRYL